MAVDRDNFDNLLARGDVRLLENIAHVAAAACCPFLAAASPALFGFAGFTDLDHVRDPATREHPIMSARIRREMPRPKPAIRCGRRTSK